MKSKVSTHLRSVPSRVDSSFEATCGRGSAIVLLAVGILGLAVGWWGGYTTGRQGVAVAAEPLVAKTPPTLEQSEAARGRLADAGPSLRTPVRLAPTLVQESSAPPVAAAEAMIPGREERAEGDRAAAIGGGMGLEGRLGLGGRLGLRGRLGRGGDPEERLALAKEILEENSGDGRTMQALNVLFELEPDTARAKLFALLESEDPGAQGMAAGVIHSAARHEGALSADDLAALWELGDRDVQFAVASTSEVRGDDTFTRRYEAACAVDLASEDPQVRARAVRDLAKSRSETSMSMLAPLLGDDNEEVRIEVLRSVRVVGGDPVLLEAIRGLQDDPSDRVSRMATRIVERADRGRERMGRMGLRDGR